ncbi:MAG: DNA polymerase, partial [Clostridiales bacterium]|nr:DNA polymerase [Clostridiales bacterium]
MKKIVLIDGHSILNRAFYGIPELTNSEGMHTNAVYGFLNIMFKILDEEQPDYLTVAFDVSAPTFRHKMYPEYKGNRKPMLPELREQVPVIKDVLHAMGIETVEKPGYEADDIIGTISRQAEGTGMDVALISGDRDMLQLATDKVKVRIPKTKRGGTEIEDYLATDVVERYQVTPTEFIDVKALMGDSSDNIPGVPGIGEKGATAIIVKYKSIENAYGHVDEITPNRARTALEEHYDMAVMSKALATIETHADIDYNIESAAVGDFYTPEAYVWFKRLEFKQLLARFDDVNRGGNKAEESFATLTEAGEREAFFKDYAGAAQAAVVYLEEGERVYGVAVAVADEVKAGDGVAKTGAGDDAVGAGADSEAKSGAGAVRAVYLPCADEMSRCLLEGSLQAFCDSCGMIISPDLKSLLKHVSVKKRHGADTGIMAYLLNPLKNEYSYDDIAKDYLGEMIPAKADLLGKLKLDKAAGQQPEAVAKLACYMAYTAYKAANPLTDALKESGMYKLYTDMELPLVWVLDGMEREGVSVDASALASYGEELSEKIAGLEGDIYEKAGEEFNINSPKQLGVIIFEKLQMKGGKKTKTGYSTPADVLEKL